METAVRNAKAWVSAAIAAADRFSVGHGHGPDPSFSEVLLAVAAANALRFIRGIAEIVNVQDLEVMVLALRRDCASDRDKSRCCLPNVACLSHGAAIRETGARH
jgi:hypothetical protein